MKTNNKLTGYMFLMVGILFAVLPLQAQVYNGQSYSAAPTVAFQSTSVMQTSGSTYASQPMLNADGTATYAGASEDAIQTMSGPRKIGGQTIEGTPLGDAVLPLMLMALLFGAITALKRKRIVS